MSCLVWISTNLFYILSYSANNQTGNWRDVDGNGFEYYVSNTTVQSYHEAGNECEALGGSLFQSVFLTTANNSKIPISGIPVKKFHIGRCAEIRWNDSTAPSETTLSEFSLHNEKRCCVYLSIGRHFMNADVEGCNVTSHFICQRKTGLSPRRVENTVSVRPESNDSATTKVHAVSGSIDFSIDLASFLIGFGIPCPFLLAAVIKIICSVNHSKRKRKRKRVGTSVSSAIASNSYSQQSTDISSTINQNYEPVYDVPSEISQTRQNGRPSNGYRMDGYERPLAMHHPDSYVESAAYEEYDFSRSRLYPH